MKRKVPFFLAKTLILTILFTVLYYLIFLSPQISKQKRLNDKIISLSSNLSILVQNRLSFIELTRLDPKSPSFNSQKSELINTIKITNQKGLNEPSFPDKAKEIFQRQNKLLEKVFTTNSYEEGVLLLKSKESLELLTDQTNLILDLQRELDNLKKELK